MSRLFLVDSFTKEAFRGNPAAVVILEEDRPDAWMQNVAFEMNLSETAFLKKEGEAWRLRWFTPTVEIDLCGHATLASAFVLWNEGIVPETETLNFDTLSGRLSATKKESWITLDFPTLAPEPCAPPKGLKEALGLTTNPDYVGINSARFLLVDISDQDRVRLLAPDFVKLAKLEPRAVIVTAKGTGKTDFVSRFFGPNVGVNEDPVTGAAHCMLGPYWKKKLGKDEMKAYQSSKRGGFVRVRPETDRTYLSGEAVLISRGELL